MNKSITKKLFSVITLTLFLVAILTSLIFISNRSIANLNPPPPVTLESRLTQTGPRQLTHNFSVNNLGSNQKITRPHSEIEYKDSTDSSAQYELLRRKKLSVDATSATHDDILVRHKYLYRAVIRVDIATDGSPDREKRHAESSGIMFKTEPILKTAFANPLQSSREIEISTILASGEGTKFQLSYRKVERDIGSSTPPNFSGEPNYFEENKTKGKVQNLNLDKEHKFEIGGRYWINDTAQPITISSTIQTEWTPLVIDSPSVDLTISTQTNPTRLRMNMNLSIRNKANIESVTFKLFKGSSANDVNTHVSDIDFNKPFPTGNEWFQDISSADPRIIPLQFYRFEVFLRYKLPSHPTNQRLLKGTSNTIRWPREQNPDLSKRELEYSTAPSEDIEIDSLKVKYNLQGFNRDLGDKLYVQLWSKNGWTSTPPETDTDDGWSPVGTGRTDITPRAQNDTDYYEDLGRVGRNKWYKTKTTIEFKNNEGNDDKYDFPSNALYVGKAIPTGTKDSINLLTTNRDPVTIEASYKLPGTNDSSEAIKEIDYHLHESDSSGGNSPRPTEIREKSGVRDQGYKVSLEDKTNIIKDGKWYAIQVTITYDLGDGTDRTLIFFTDWVTKFPTLNKKSFQRKDGENSQVEINNLRMMYNLSNFNKDLGDRLYVHLYSSNNRGNETPPINDQSWTSEWGGSEREIENPDPNDDFTREFPNLDRRKWYRVKTVIRYTGIDGQRISVEDISIPLYVGRIKPTMTKGQFIVNTINFHPHIKFSVEYSDPDQNDRDNTIKSIEYHLYSADDANGTNPEPVGNLTENSNDRSEGYKVEIDDTNDEIVSNKWYAVRIRVTYDLNQKANPISPPFFSNWIKKYPTYNKQELNYAQDPSEDIEVNNLKMTYNLTNFGIENTDKLYMRLYSSDNKFNNKPSENDPSWTAWGDSRRDITEYVKDNEDFNIPLENLDRQKWWKVKTTIEFQDKGIPKEYHFFSNMKYVGKSIPKSNKDLYTIKQIKDSGTGKISVKYNEPNKNDPENAIKKIHYKLYSANNQAGDGSKPTKLEGESEVRDGGYAVVLDEKNEDIIQNDKWYAIEVTITYDLGDSNNRIKTEFLGWSKIAVTKNNAASCWWIWIIIIFGILIIHGVSWYIYRKVRYEPFVDPDQNPIGTYGQNTN